MNVDTFGAYVRAELEHWGGVFALHRDCEYLGHRSKDMLALLMEFGGEMPPRVVGFKPLEIDLRAQVIEDAVADMARFNKERACIMRAYYCGRGRRAHERKDTAEQLVRRALNWPTYSISRDRWFREHAEGFAEVRGWLRAQGVAAA